MNTNTEKQYHKNSVLSLPEVSKYTNLSKDEVRKLVNENKLPYIRLTTTGHLKFRVEDVDKAIAKLFNTKYHQGVDTDS